MDPSGKLVYTRKSTTFHSLSFIQIFPSKIWNSNTYGFEKTLSYALERAWCVALRRDANEVPSALTRESLSSRCVLFHLSNPSIHPFQLGQDEPMYSMDPSGKLVYIHNQVVISGNIQALGNDTSPEGNQISLTVKEIGTTEIFAHVLLHSPNGCFVTIVGDGEYIIYTALAWRNKSFGNGISFA